MIIKNWLSFPFFPSQLPRHCRTASAAILEYIDDASSMTSLPRDIQNQPWDIQNYSTVTWPELPIVIGSLYIDV